MNNVSKEKGDKFESIVEKIYFQIANNECKLSNNLQ